MMISIKTDREIALMKEAGHIVAMVFETLKPMLKSGVSTQELDLKAKEVIESFGATPTFKGYGGFPGNICISVNDTVIHGIPSNKIILHEGDLVSLDVGATYKGYCGDACRTYPVGVTTEKNRRLMEVCEQSFFEGCELLKDGVRLGDISHRIQEYNESFGYSLIREFTGHGIGSHLHEDPSIPNYGQAGTGPIIKKGMTLAIEPMVCEGKPQVRILKDGWTVKTKDGKMSCHFENTVVVTDNGYEILTKLKESN